MYNEYLELLKAMNAYARAIEKEPSYITVGLCFRITKSSLREKMQDIFKAWPKYSGNPNYPIPCEGERQDFYYYQDKKMYRLNPNAKYYAMRKDLLNFMIERLEEMTDV